ncbi:MAG TPA: type II toxin-antitoxin system prevent-host-death family antitoxin [Candidatus Methylomirabilis sp.]|nr:type II toxin-antitoxin system prevent-host-death family antitoxin [Candidatus Methylomirabilis sp.]
MATATVREVQHQLAAILDRVAQGEEVTVTRRGRAVARIIPAVRAKRPRWPDFAARMKRRFPGGQLPGPPVSALIRADREERL